MAWLSLPAALLLASAFIFGKALRASSVQGRRAGISFAAGTSIAYVFVHLLPELAERQQDITSAFASIVPLSTAIIYLVAMVGFVTFYGLDNMVFVHRSPDHPSSYEHDDARIYALHMVGFAVYSAITSYLLLDFITPPTQLVIYTLAFFLHFLVIDHSLRREYGSRYDNAGRWVLAASVLAGWLVSILLPLSEYLISLLLGFVSGGVVFNSIKDEMPRVGEGKIKLFLLGTVLYAALVLLL